MRLLPAAIDASLAVGDLAAAGTACAELEALARNVGTEFLVATAAQARGVVALAEGDTATALAAARRSAAIWRALGAPYDVARADALIGARLPRARRRGDRGAPARGDAREALRALGAAPDAERVAALGPGERPAAGHGLSARELEVLRRVASGATNKAIAAELVLSERTMIAT